MGNFATFFRQRDARKEALEQKIDQWKNFFKTYPQYFTKNVQKEILLYKKNNVHGETHLQLNQMTQMINDDELKEKLLKSIVPMQH